MTMYLSTMLYNTTKGGIFFLFLVIDSSRSKLREESFFNENYT